MSTTTNNRRPAITASVMSGQGMVQRIAPRYRLATFAPTMHKVWRSILVVCVIAPWWFGLAAFAWTMMAGWTVCVGAFTWPLRALGRGRRRRKRAEAEHAAIIEAIGRGQR